MSLGYAFGDLGKATQLWVHLESWDCMRATAIFILRHFQFVITTTTFTDTLASCNITLFILILLILSSHFADKEMQLIEVE